MGDWPPFLPQTHWAPVIHSWSSILGPTAGGRLANTPVSATWTANNRAFYIPVLIPEKMTIAQLFHFNGATASGNIDVGVYSIDYTRLVSSGAVAQSGTSAFQIFNVTDTQVSAGIYYLGVSLSSTAGTGMFTTLVGRAYAMVGIVMQESAHPLPATMTPVTMGTVLTVPWVGLTDRTVF